MARYTQLERKKILESRKSSESIRDFSTRCGVSTTSIYQWLKEIDPRSSASFTSLEVTYAPEDRVDTICIIYENFTIQLPVHTDVSYVRSILGC
jgi:transposase-like protein